MATASPGFYSHLASALRERLATIADRAMRERDPAAHLERLKTVSEQITSLQQGLPADASPKLRHYLEQCSYDKALDFVESNRLAE